MIRPGHGPECMPPIRCKHPMMYVSSSTPGNRNCPNVASPLQTHAIIGVAFFCHGISDRRGSSTTAKYNPISSEHYLYLSGIRYVVHRLSNRTCVARTKRGCESSLDTRLALVNSRDIPHKLGISNQHISMDTPQGGRAPGNMNVWPTLTMPLSSIALLSTTSVRHPRFCIHYWIACGPCPL